MAKTRGTEHTTLTETAALVVRELEKLPGIKMIAPGMISQSRRGGGRFLTAVYTASGMELIISGQSTQKVAIHTTTPAKKVFTTLRSAKRLANFTFKERERRPGV